MKWYTSRSSCLWLSANTLPYALKSTAATLRASLDVTCLHNVTNVMMPTPNIAAFDTEITAQIERICTRCYFAENFTVELVLHASRQLCPCSPYEQYGVDQLLRHEVPKTDQLYSSTRRKNDECISGGHKNYNHHDGADTLQQPTSCEPRLHWCFNAACDWRLFWWRTAGRQCAGNCFTGCAIISSWRKCLLHRPEPEKKRILTPVVRMST